MRGVHDLAQPAFPHTAVELVELGGAWTLDKRVIAITYNLVAEKIPDIIEHDKGYDLNDINRYVAELIRRVQRKRPKR